MVVDIGLKTYGSIKDLIINSNNILAMVVDIALKTYGSIKDLIITYVKRIGFPSDVLVFPFPLTLTTTALFLPAGDEPEENAKKIK